MAPEQAAGAEGPDDRGRRLRPGRDPLRAADRPAAVPRPTTPLETLLQVLRAGAGAAAAAERRRRPRPGDDLPEVPGEGPRQALRLGGRAGRRPGASARRPADPGPAGDAGRARGEVGPPQPAAGRPHRAGGGCWAVGLLVVAGLGWRNVALRAQAMSDLGQARGQLAAAQADTDQARASRRRATSAGRGAAPARRAAEGPGRQGRGGRPAAPAIGGRGTRPGPTPHGRRSPRAQAARSGAARGPPHPLRRRPAAFAHVAWQADNVSTARELLDKYREPAGDDPARL